VYLVIIAREPKKYLEDTRWAEQFGAIDGQRIEHYGKVTSLRVWYSGSYEVEYGFSDETLWALPLDAGTKKVIFNGMKILSERGSILSRLQQQMKTCKWFSCLLNSKILHL